MYDAIVFDFGNVLCGLDRMAFARAASGHCALAPETIDAALWGGELEHSFETGRMDSRAYFARVRAMLDLDPDYSYDEFTADFSRIIKPYPEGEEGLRFAAEKGKRTFILSNTSFLHARMIFGNETLASIPELHILSYKVGVMKPHPGIWQALLRYSGLPAERCLYIDDVPAYCEAARSLGFDAAHFDKNSTNLRTLIENVVP